MGFTVKKIKNLFKIFNVQVNFGLPAENEKKREKFLTAKYGAHQMALIRLNV